MRKFHGDHLLGGFNFDSALVEWILARSRRRAGPSLRRDQRGAEGRRSRMLQVAEAVKIRLAEQKTDKVPVRCRWISWWTTWAAVQFRGRSTGNSTPP